MIGTLNKNQSFPKFSAVRTPYLMYDIKESDNKHDTGYPHDGRADKDSYPHDGRADKDSYPHDGRADKDSYPHDRHNQYIIGNIILI